jgi:hypothetical protein
MRQEVRIDLDELNPWSTGLEVFASHRAYVRVVIDGVPDPVEGEVAAVTEDFVVLERRADDADTDTGDATWIRRDRIVTVTSRYHYFDRYLEAKKRVAQDPTILDRVRDALEAFRRQGHPPPTGPKGIGGYPTYSDVAATLDGISSLQVEAAIELLDEAT